MKAMRISELSKLTGASIRSLRYYEAKGLIATQREENGYRVFNQMAVERVKTIQFYLSLGFTTEQIESFLNCVMKNQESLCDDLLPLYTEKLQDIERQMEMLQMLQANLKDRISYIEQQRLQGLPVELPAK
ncbi:DNA-binding transcriptional MerR regulator [Bacillus sp. 3255]|nr:DNA-binding transcriptional MerR regulator [Bacillus sp. 3255]